MVVDYSQLFSILTIQLSENVHDLTYCIDYTIHQNCEFQLYERATMKKDFKTDEIADVTI